MLAIIFLLDPWYACVLYGISAMFWLIFIRFLLSTLWGKFSTRNMRIWVLEQKGKILVWQVDRDFRKLKVELNQMAKIFD